MKRVFGFAGPSGVGKTTLLCRLIFLWAARGERVAAVKHSHHAALDRINRGDTLRFLEAGASSATLAGSGGDAVRWSGSTDLHFRWRTASELIASEDAELVLVEGFKSERSWPTIFVGPDLAALHAQVIALVSDTPLHSDLPLFRRDDVTGLATFLDTIRRS